MKKVCLSVVLFLLLAVALAGATDAGNLVVRTVDGNLVIIHPDGTQEQISSEAGSAVISPDHRAVAFTVVHMQKVQGPEFWRVDAKLFVMTLGTSVTTELAHPPAGTGFGQIAWTPDGSAIAYEATARGNAGTVDLFLAPFPSERGQVRNLGHWYQGFSFSPDGRRIVHAINSPFGLEVLDVATGTRTLLHKASNVVWEAKFSPDGKFIAYQKTVGEPASSVQDSADDDEPDCSSPNKELRLYSLVDGSDTAVAIANAPPSVYNFSWSPDSRRLAIELGTEDCASPSGDAAVFVTSVDQKIQKQISSSSPSVQPAFSPDGSAIAFVDSSQFPARLFRYDVATETRSVIRRASATENDYVLLEWK